MVRRTLVSGPPDASGKGTEALRQHPHREPAIIELLGTARKCHGGSEVNALRRPQSSQRVQDVVVMDLLSRNALADLLSRAAESGTHQLEPFGKSEAGPFRVAHRL